jgi:thiosulfate/3-mercaptopyruvate sulfurtransferase
MLPHPLRTLAAMEPFGPVVAGEWLEEHLGEVVVADVRWKLQGDVGERFAAGHVPGAVLLDLDADLAGEPGGDRGRHPLPSPEDFARSMSEQGIGDEAAVVAYDDVRGSVAARLWWMLRATGHRAALLDGGLDGWPGPLETGPARPRPAATFTARPWPADRVVHTEEVERLRLDPDVVILDLRAAERYRGETEPIDPVAGHVPGARSAAWTGNVDEAGRFRSPEELRRRYEDLGASGRRVIVHCGSGVTACHGLVALELAGLPEADLYVDSWSGWVADPSRPVATGADP